MAEPSAQSNKEFKIVIFVIIGLIIFWAIAIPAIAKGPRG